MIVGVVMQRRKKVRIKYQNIFNLGSFLFLSILLILYGYRFLHYRAISLGKDEPKNAKKNDIYTTLTVQNVGKKSLKVKNDVYHFEGKNVDNYLYYSGNLWRIVSFTDKDVTLISDMPVTALPLEEEYSNSNIDTWLNEEYYAILKKDYLLKTNTCINEKEKECTSFSHDVVLPSLEMYDLTGGNNGFINNGYYMYFSNEGNLYYYMDAEGKVHEESSLYHFGLKPVITISNVDVVKGKGTEKNPYIIEQLPTSLENVSVGSYLEYSGSIWRIIENTNSVKIMLTETTGEKPIYFENYTENSTVGNYLNTTFYNTLQDVDTILLGVWYTGTYDGIVNHILSVKTNAYVGLPQMNDIYLFDGSEYVLMNQSALGEVVYKVEKDGRISKGEVNTNYAIKPVLNLRNDFQVTGEGTYHSPYKIVGEE